MPYAHRWFEWVLNKVSLQETIFVADGTEDYLKACALSGEPQITSMVPHDEDRGLPIIKPYVQTLVGEPYQRTTYEVHS